MQRLRRLIAISILLVALVTVSILAFSVFSPKPVGNGGSLQIVWQQFLPGFSGKSVIETSDGGYLALGTTAVISKDELNEPIFMNEQPIIVKTDSVGNVQWKKSFQILGLTPTLSTIAQTRDGGYVVVGGVTNSSDYENPFSRFCLIKLDSSGEVNWTQTYAGSLYAKNNVFNIVSQTSDGGYTLFGTWTRYWDYHGFSQSYLVKTDETGDVYFSKDINVGPASSMSQVSDGYVFFTSRQASGGGTKFMIVKTDFNGTIIWSKDYKENGASSAYEEFGLVTSDGGYILSGSLVSPDQGWIVKTDAEGKMLWNRTYPNVIDINSIAPAEEGGYLIGGVANATKISYIEGTTYTAWFAKIDNFGNVEAEFNAGPVTLKHSTSPSRIITTGDGDFICVGTWDSTYQASGNQHFWIAKIHL